MDKKLETLFENLDKEIFTPEFQEQISNIVEESVNKKVQERLDLELQQVDEDHANKTKLVLDRLQETVNEHFNKVDEDRTQKLLNFKKIQEQSFNKKLKIVKEGYEKILKKDTQKHVLEMAKSLSDYLDQYLEELIPTKTVQESARNTFVQEQLNHARKLLGIDSSAIPENIKKAVINGKQQMDKVLKENAELKKLNAIEESKRVLTEKTANLPIEQAKFVRSKLTGKTADFINENFSYVLNMFDRSIRQEKTTLLSETKKPELDRSKIKEEMKATESLEYDPENPYLGMYLEGLGYRK